MTGPEWLKPNVESWAYSGVAHHFPEDAVGLDVTMTHVIGETGGLLPIWVIYLQIDGTVKVDGLYLSKALPPSLTTEKTVDAALEELAKLRHDRRGQIRTSIAKGDAQPQMSLPSSVDLPASGV